MFAIYFAYNRWEDGGDYLAFYRLIRRMVKAWRAAGFELVFVFDGAKPLAKHSTVIARFQDGIGNSRKFHEALNKEENSNTMLTFGGKRILPLFVFDALVAALSELKVTMEFVPDGEADAAVVAVAERRGAYILGNDSDFIILAAGCSNVRGYIPTEGVQWINNNKRKGSLIPPVSWKNPAVHVKVYSTPALCKHLGVLPNHLSLLSSIVGNDYASFEGFWMAVREKEDVRRAKESDEPLERQPPYWRLQYAANILRGIPLPDMKTEEDAIAHVRDVMSAMRGGRNVRDELVDTVVTATLQYALPTDRVCCEAYPFCKGCTETSPLLKQYGYAQRGGRLKPLTNAYMYPDRVYPWSLAEDPIYAPLRSSPPSCAVRMLAYSIFFSAVAPRTEITEYERNSEERLVPRVHVLPPSPSTAACLLPLHERIRIYLSPFGHKPAREIGKLPAHLHPLAAALRLCVLLPHDSGRWSHAELFAFARSALGSLEAFGTLQDDDNSLDSIGRVPLTSRNVQRVAQFSASLHDLHLLAQALLLSTPGKIKTHLFVWKFVDGASLHCLLKGKEPAAAWRRPDEDQVHHVVSAALTGLPQNVVEGWGVGIAPPRRPKARTRTRTAAAKTSAPTPAAPKATAAATAPQPVIASAPTTTPPSSSPDPLVMVPTQISVKAAHRQHHRRR